MRRNASENGHPTLRRTTPLYRAVIAAILALCFTAGCGPTGGRGLDELDGQLLVWHSWSPGAEANAIDALIDGFTLIHPNVTIVTETIPKAELAQQFLDQTAAGLGPDILIGIETPEIKRFADGGALQSLSGYTLDTTALLGEAVDALTLNGELIGIPFSAHTNVLYHNRALTDGEAPGSVPELLRAAQSGLRVGIPTDFYNAAWGIGAFGGQIFDENGEFALDEGAGFADWLTWLSTAQRDPNIILSNDIEPLREEFKQGELAYYIGPSYELPQLQEALGADSVGVALLPPFGEHPAVPFLELEVIAISGSSARGELAIELAEFLVNATQQRRLALSNLGRIPVSTKMGRVALRVDPLASDLVQQRDHAIIVPLDKIDMETEFIQLGDSIYNQVLEGVLSPSEAVRVFAAEMERVAP